MAILQSIELQFSDDHWDLIILARGNTTQYVGKYDEELT